MNPVAYESYLKGRYFWNKRTADGLKVALAYFNQAIDEDSKYAQAYSGLADTYALLGDWQYAVMTPKEALPKAKAAAIKALELDSTLGEAHNSLAFCLDGFDWDFDSAGKEFQRAIELNPGYATAHHWYAWHLALLRRYDEAIVEMRRAENRGSAVSRHQRRPGGAACPCAFRTTNRYDRAARPSKWIPILASRTITSARHTSRNT